MMTPALLIQFALCPIVLISLLWVTAPYGRHYKTGWGLRLPNRTAWVLMELPALLVITLLVLGSPAAESPIALVPLALWCMHYAYRTFIFPVLMRPSRNTFPALLVLFAVGFNGLNGYNNAGALIHDASSAGSLITLHFVVGTVIFLTGFLLHVHSDHMIRSLRKPGETGYRIPMGGLFRMVSSPNYLGEMIQWTGWAILTWSWAGLAFALFTVCNLAPRAISNHRWYRERFSHYPSERKILIPWLY